MITYGQFRYGGTASRMSGIDVSSRKFTSYTNAAVEQLLRRGKWWGTFRSMRCCVYDEHVTWPRQVQTILAIRAGREVQRVYNEWFNFLPMEHTGYYYRDYKLDGMRGAGHTVVEGTSPVFHPIECNQNVFLQFFISDPTDLGKTMTVCGLDENGQWVRTQRKDGTIQDGVCLTLASPMVQTPMPFRKVTRIVRQETNYTVRGFQVGPGGLLPLCAYEPSETTPEYVRTRVARRHANYQNWYGCCQLEVEALVKIKFVPVKYDDDIMQIDNEAAIVNMIFAQRAKESGDITNARAYEADAFRELNFQMKDYFPDENFVVDFQPFGRDNLNRDGIRIGML